jgi:hypothetical protein
VDRPWYAASVASPRSGRRGIRCLRRVASAGAFALAGTAGFRLADAADGPGATVNPGILVSGVAARSSAFALGGELSFMFFPRGGKIQQQLGFGAFSQFQTYNLDHGRYALGLQAGNIVGAEVGYSYNERGESSAAMHGVHAAVFASAGLAVASLRATIPVAAVDEDLLHRSPGFELGLCFALKFPIPIGKIDVLGNLPAGRLLRDGNRRIVADLVFGNASPATLRPAVNCLAREEREQLASAWATDGLLEHASIASFLRLAFELEALGAPSVLIRRCLAAAEDEQRHTRLCFALASEFAGFPIGPGPLPFVMPRPPSLALLARETLLDGCVGEAVAAHAASLAREDARDPVVRSMLDVIAHDEASHARLGWDILAFVHRQKHSLPIERLERTPPMPYPVSLGSRAHGRIPACVARRIQQQTWTRARERLA